MRTRARVRAGALAGALAILPCLALANGRFPATNAIVVAPKDPGLVLLRSTFGLLVSSDRGASWDWVCEQSIGYGGVEDPPFAITGKPTIVGALFAGLALSQDRACNFALATGPLDKQVFSDVVVSRTRPSEVLALSSSYDRRDDAGNNHYRSFVFASRDDGASFSLVGTALDPSILFETIEISESDPSRVYLSGARDLVTGTVGVILVSKDAGLTFREYGVPLEKDERAPFIGAVDPDNPDRVYVRIAGSPDLARNRLLVSDDGAVTSRLVWSSSGPLAGLALSPDGKKVYAGSVKDGLVVAPRDTLAFEPRAKIQVQCLATAGDRIYACSNEQSGFIAGASTDDGRTFAPLLRLSGLRGPLACPGGSRTTSECARLWPRLKIDLGVVDDAGADASPSPPVTVSASGGCSAVGGGGMVAGAGLSLLAVLAMLVRRRGG